MRKAFYFYANPYQHGSMTAARALQAKLLSLGAVVCAPEWMRAQGVGAKDADGEKISAAVAFGGDGTLLRLAPEAARRGWPMLGVHTGTVGFLMQGDADKPEETAALLMRDVYPLECHAMLRVACSKGDYLALNDVSITRGEHPGVIAVKAEADGERVYTLHGDGALLSTPLGATAYALAAGGPIVRPDLQCLSIVPLCAREPLARAVMLPPTARVAFSVEGSPRRRLQLAVDGQTLLPIEAPETVQAALSDIQARLIVSRRSFFATLRQKQRVWSEEEEQE